MSDLAALLAVLQLSDSAFPSGRYTLSHGLETLAQSGFVRTPERARTLSALLADHVRLGVAPSDGTALACAHRAAGELDAVVRVDERLTAVKLAREGRDASTRTGRALLSTASAAFGPIAADYADLVHNGQSPGNHAVVLGVLAAGLGVPGIAAVTGELFAFAAGWVAAAVRLAVTDHRTAQAVLADVRPVLVDAARQAVRSDVSRIASHTPLLDVMAMRHEETELRLFAS